MAFPISKLVIDQIVQRFADETYGFNATYNALAPTYGVAADMAIDFAPVDNKSKNFVLANVAPQDWISTGAFRYPLLSLFTAAAANENRQKFHQFSGSVEAGLNVFLSWKEERLKLAVFEPKAWCVEETVCTVLNRARNAFPIDQDWGDGVVYNGGVSWQKSRVERDNEFWGQVIAFRMQFEVDERGEV